MEIILFLAAVFFLPLFPSYILYKLLPSRATVAGPLRGWNINLSGAFAGYFLLVLIAAFMVREQVQRDYDSGSFQVWKVVGKVSSPEEYQDFAGKPVVGFDPRPVIVFSDGRFELEIIVRRSRTGTDSMEFPKVLFGGPAHKKETRYLKFNDEYKVDQKTRTIEFKNEIVLKTLQPLANQASPTTSEEPSIR
jgi:hypothetical protein